MSDLITEVAAVLAKAGTTKTASPQAVEIASIIENEFFLYPNAHKDAIYTMQEVSLYSMYAVRKDLEFVFDKHRPLFSALLKNKREKAVSEYEGIDEKFVMRVVENDSFDIDEDFEFMVEVLKTFIVIDTCKEALEAFYDFETNQSIPF